MPEPATLALFALSALALVAIPGPNLIYIVTRSIDQGRRAGLASALGVETATLVHVAAAAAGLSARARVQRHRLQHRQVRRGGVPALPRRCAPCSPAPRPRPSAVHAAVPTRRVYAEGFVVNLLNPKVALFFLALLPAVHRPRARRNAWLQVLTLGVVLVAIGLAIDLAYALAAGSAGAWVRGSAMLERRRRWATGGVYIVLAAVALAGSRRAQ